MDVVHDFDPKRGRPPKYDWDLLTDGTPRRLYRDQDFDAELYSFRTMVHRKARDLGLKAHTKINDADASIEIQFTEKSWLFKHWALPNGWMFHWDRKTNRVWIFWQRTHHGPVGITGGLALLAFTKRPWTYCGGALLAWGLTDLHDLKRWFKRDIYPGHDT